VIEICEQLELTDAIFVGHSVSAMIGVIAAERAPERIGKLVLVGPSPRYLDDEGYRGGFTSEDIAGLLESLDSNYLGWSRTYAPVIMGQPDRPDLGEELTNSFCRTDPEIARHFARVTFLSDNREDLRRVTTPSLVLQCSDDVIAPHSVGEYVHEQLPNSKLVHLQAKGHCPNLSAPAETVAAIRTFL
jgi:sigma-B regulation protein RsbQ